MFKDHSLGATCTANGVQYSVWAPESACVTVKIEASDGTRRELPLTKDAGGFHQGVDSAGRAGDAYQYQLDRIGSFPDPVSRGQATDVHGASLVIDPREFRWSDQEWIRPDFRELVIYELHVGTFTFEGTFLAACDRLADLRDLGINAIQLMPLADFPGSRNWGYDGVLIYAPARCYGTPDDLRTLVNRAHAHGIAVILDVVYNHLGPDGNYLTQFTPHYFNSAHHTPWGSALNFDSEMAGPVREFFGRNPLYWMTEFHIDGFRLDATHEIRDDTSPHILAEITAGVHERGGYVIAEDPRNDVAMITPVADGGLGFDAVWADDFHHGVRVGQTRESSAYYQDFSGSVEEVVDTLANGWFYRGQKSKNSGSPRGTECATLPPERFLHCISNHDQTGNRAFGERLNQLISPEAYRALSALLLLSPYTPMLFMGQEWGAKTPFLYFTDHNRDLGEKITEGRRKEFANFAEFSDPSTLTQIPDPQSDETFQRSKLRWNERDGQDALALLALHRDAIQLRRRLPALRPLTRENWSVQSLPWGAGAILSHAADQSYVLLFDLEGGHAGSFSGMNQAEVLFSSDAVAYSGHDRIDWSSERCEVRFQVPGVLLLRSSPSVSV